MEAPSIHSDLDRRKAAILRAVVRDYVQTGLPVSSSRLLKRYRLKVSTATIRNEMGRLEDEGFLVQPFTSAGRIPTDKGYRWFVDNWPGPEWPILAQSAQAEIDGALEADFKGVEELLGSTSNLLSRITESAGVAIAPPPLDNRLRRLELFARDSRRATIILVDDSGDVHQGIVEFSEDKADQDLTELAASLNVALHGTRFEDLAPMTTVGGISEADRAALSREIARVLSADSTRRFFRGGTSNILSPDKFSDMAVAHEILAAFEDAPTMSSLADAARGSGPVLVFIGSEVPVVQMQACAAIFAPFDAGEGRTGSVGVIGPTRMNYPQTISAVESVARSLSRLFEPAN